MSSFTHSVVLFTDEDGLPIEFNIQNVVEKGTLKAMIEHGSGMCTLDSNAVHLVSPGTSVINVDANRTILSSRYIFDCARQNFLLDMDDYKLRVDEVEASDFSEENSLHLSRKSSDNENSVDNAVPKEKSISPQDMDLPKSNHDFDFTSTCNVDEKRNPKGNQSSDASVAATDVCLPVSHVSESSSIGTANQQESSTRFKSPLKLQTSSESLDRSHVSSTPEALISKSSNFSNVNLRESLSHVQSPQKSKTSSENFDHSDVSSTPEGLVSKSSNFSKVNLRESSSQLKSPKKSRTPDESHNRSHVSSTPDDLFSSKESHKASPSKVSVPDRVSGNSDEGDDIFVDALSFGFLEEVEVVANEPVVADPVPSVSNAARVSPINAIIVSSSQPQDDDMDQIGNVVVDKSKEKEVGHDEDSLSQSYTVSSSADAQVPVTKNSPHDTSADIFGVEANAPDSPSQSSERQQYILNLEKEIEKILHKPSPRSLQDKIVMVKYISVVKKLDPAIVLQTLQNF